MSIPAETFDIENLLWMIFILFVIISQLAGARKNKQKFPEAQESGKETSTPSEFDNLFYPAEVETAPQTPPVIKTETVIISKQVPEKQNEVSARRIDSVLPDVELFQQTAEVAQKMEPKKKEPPDEKLVLSAQLPRTGAWLDLSTPDSLRNAIVAREILGPPLALRDIRSHPPYSV